MAENAGLAIEATISNGDEIGSILAAAIHNESDLLVIGMPKHTWMIGHTAHNLAGGRSLCAARNPVTAAVCAFLYEGVGALNKPLRSVTHISFEILDAVSTI